MGGKDTSVELWTPVVEAVHTCSFIIPWIRRNAHTGSRRCLTGQLSGGVHGMPTPNLDKNKQDSVPNGTIPVSEEEKIMDPEIKGKAGYKKSWIVQYWRFSTANKKKKDTYFPLLRTPLIPKPANEHDPKPVPSVNVQHHFFKMHLQFYLPASLV